MSSDAVVSFRDVTKRYSRYDGILKLKNAIDRLKNGQLGKRLVHEDDFYALRNVNFTLKKGQRLGIIGPNGAGKSTTLKLIGRIAYPTSGKIVVKGKVGGLIELASGFQNDLTGRENVYLQSALLGFSRRETQGMIDRILEISELENFIDVPIKRYSSGMKVRLGFAVIMCTTPDIVLLDEVLAVGDARFKEKSMAMVEQYLEGRTLVFVTHSMNQIENLCERVLVLSHGNVAFDGSPKEAIAAYTEIQKKADANAKSITVQRKVKRGFSEEHKVSVAKVEFRGSESSAERTFVKGEMAEIAIYLDYKEVLGNLRLKVRIKRSVVGQITELLAGKELDVDLSDSNPSEPVRVAFETGVLAAGEYAFEVSPEFERQSEGTAIVVYREAFEVIAKQEAEKALGLIDLDFRIVT